jgi:tetratricopeptide (TPR) repeat protein
MSRSEDNGPANVREGLRAVERFWQAAPPDAFRNLYAHFPHPFLAPCEFFALTAIAEGAGRGFGQIPQYLPFGRAVGEGGTYGFYVTPETVLGRWPVVYWDDDEMYLRPVSYDFEAFLRGCVLVGRYETEDQAEADLSDWSEIADRREFARRVGLPVELLLDPIPRNNTELYERLASSDPQDAVSLCHLGCVWRARGNSERALDFFHRASEAAPWFGDPPYLVADVYRERGDRPRAIRSWWAVVQRLLPFCTRTWEWDLGAEHPEADIYEVAADGLAQFCDEAESDLRAQPLWRVVAHDDPYDPDVRESLADALLAQNDLAGAEREYLNALSLCFSERGKQPERLYSALLALYERAGRARDAALVRYDRTLPRPIL